MKIADSAIHLYAKHTALEQQQKRESLTVWQGGREPRVTLSEGDGGKEINPRKELQNLQRDMVSLSHPGGNVRRRVAPGDSEDVKDKELSADLNMRLLQALFEKLTGRKFHIIDPHAVMAASTEGSDLVAQEGEVPAPAQESASAGYGLAYDYFESSYEFEKTEFAASGIITTADGQNIDFSLNLSMSREFYQEQSISIRAGDALKDPLVINFSGTAAQLTDRHFSFDIDADGTRDQIAFVRPGSGFLALDKNGDGTINDGSELFGAVSNDGFADLQAYDSDSNGWIDENDAIYNSLRIWSKNSDGEDQLVGLGMAGVGALYLGHIETLFSVKDADNELLGKVRETGLAVMENTQVVTMQQLDLVA